MTQKPQESEVEAVVGAFGGKRYGGYAIAYTHPNSSIGNENHKDGVPITFELTCWEGQYPPEKAQTVILTGVEKFVNGWRARRARPVSWQSDGSDQSKQHTSHNTEGQQS